MPDEAAKIPGNAIGKPELKWIVIPNDQLRDGMIATGMNPQVVKGLIEMNACRGNGLLNEDYYRNKPAMGKVKLMDFAKDFAAMYHTT